MVKVKSKVTPAYIFFDCRNNRVMTEIVNIDELAQSASLTNLELINNLQNYFGQCFQGKYFLGNFSNEEIQKVYNLVLS